MIWKEIMMVSLTNFMACLNAVPLSFCGKSIRLGVPNKI